jgi:hypothetical protein
MRKDVKKALEPYLEKGWEISKSSKHYQMKHREYGTVVMSSTASCPFSIKHILGDLKRAEKK